MDPLSLTASIITVIGVGGQATGALRKLASLKGAPDIVLALNNELNDLRLVVSAIHDVFQRQRDRDLASSASTSADVSDSVMNTLHLAKKKVEELNILCDRLGKSSSGSFGLIDFKRTVWLRVYKHVYRMQRDLRDIRSKLAVALGLLSSYV